MKLLLLVIPLILGFLLGYTVHFYQPRNPQPETISDLDRLSHVNDQTYPFAEIIRSIDGHDIIPLDHKNEAHSDLLKVVTNAANKAGKEMSLANSPARTKRRINDVSSLFEEALRAEIDAMPDFSCHFPMTKSGKKKRSGYPDLRIEHLPSGMIAYLDPKLFEERSIKSSFRSFYYEPAGDDSKITENAVHLLVGFPHDGKVRQWSFGESYIIDLSTLKVTLKTEFSASNKEVYQP